MTIASKAGIAASLADLRGRVDAALEGFLASATDDLHDVDAGTAPLLDEIRRLLAAGGKRLRPAFCYWGFRAAGGRDGAPIVRASAALELLHTMALVHDDLMDEAGTRRGVPSVHVHLEMGLASIADPVTRRRASISGAIIAGDLAAVLADRLFLEAGFDASVTVDALDRYHRMRTAMAAGQFLDVAGAAALDEGAARTPRPSRAASTRWRDRSRSAPRWPGRPRRSVGRSRASADRSVRPSSSATTCSTARERTGLPPRWSTRSSMRHGRALDPGCSTPKPWPPSAHWPTGW